MRHRLQRVLVVACVVLLVGAIACVVWGETADEGAGSTPVALPRACQRVTVLLAWAVGQRACGHPALRHG